MTTAVRVGSVIAEIETPKAVDSKDGDVVFSRSMSACASSRSASSVRSGAALECTYMTRTAATPTSARTAMLPYEVLRNTASGSVKLVVLTDTDESRVVTLKSTA